MNKKTANGELVAAKRYGVFIGRIAFDEHRAKGSGDGGNQNEYHTKQISFAAGGGKPADIHQNDTGSIFITKKSNGIIYFLLEITETNDIAKCLDRIKNTVGS